MPGQARMSSSLEQLPAPGSSQLVLHWQPQDTRGGCCLPVPFPVEPGLQARRNWQQECLEVSPPSPGIGHRSPGTAAPGPRPQVEPCTFFPVTPPKKSGSCPGRCSLQECAVPKAGMLRDAPSPAFLLFLLLLLLQSRSLEDHPVPVGWDTFPYPRLLQAPSKLPLDTSRGIFGGCRELGKSWGRFVKAQR